MMAMSTHPTSKTPADKDAGNASAALTPTPVVADNSVDTENPNDELEAYHERLREQIPKD
jgi:hypothetical protein